MIEKLENIKKIKFHDLKSLDGCFEILNSNEGIESFQFYYCFFKKEETKHFLSRILGKDSSFTYEEKPLGMSLLFDDFKEEKSFDLYDNLKIKKTKIGKLENSFKNIQFHSMAIYSDLFSNFQELFDSYPVEKLSFSFNNFDEQFGVQLLSHIKNLKFLRNFTISDSYINNKSMEGLCKDNNFDQNLKKLTISNTNISGNGIKKLLELISNENCQLEYLDISKNELKPESTSIIADFLNRKCNIKTLNLMDCLIDLNEEFFTSLSSNKNIQDLNISMNGILHEESFSKCLEVNNTLKRLHMTYIDFEFRLVKGFSKNNTFEFIDLSNCHLKNDSIPQIEEIFLSRLEKSFKLPFINLTDNYLTKDKVETLKTHNIDQYLIFNKAIQSYETCEDVSRCGVFTDY